MNKIRVAVIGVGYQGKFYLQKLAAHPGIRLVGISDINAFQGRKLSQQYNVSYFEDYRDLLDKIDAVFVAVPVTAHYGIVREFLQAGVDVYVEKSLTQEPEQAEDLIQIAIGNHLILQVGHSERFNMAAELMREKMQIPSYMEACRLTKFSGRGCDVDVITDLMVHDIDIILNMMEDDQPEIHALGTSVLTPLIDVADVHMVFANGCEVHLKASRVSSKVERSLKVFEPNRYLVADFLEQDLTLYQRDDPSIRVERIIREKRDVLDHEVRSFIDSVERRTAPLVDGAQGLAALRVVCDIRKSIKEPASKNLYLYDDSIHRFEKTI